MQDLLGQRRAGDAFGFGHQPMPGNGFEQRLDVVGQHVRAPEQQRIGLGRAQQRDAGTRRQAYAHAGILAAARQ
ncbi:hypothetical protein D3C80_2069390 [compost metagenome]